jgi:hypothetical protein
VLANCKQRRRWLVATAGLVAALGLLLTLPLTTLAGTPPINSLKKSVTSKASHTVRSVTSTATHSTSSTGSGSSPSSGSSYTPPMHGTNPHGQGTVVSSSVSPSSHNPYSYKPGGSGGEVLVVGRGRSWQGRNGKYHSHTTIAALFGKELLGTNANQGQSSGGPLGWLNNSLGRICKTSSGTVCLTLLAADTSARQNGAHTHFEAVGVRSEKLNGLNASVGRSDSGIHRYGSCQTSYGDSSVASLSTQSGQVAGVAQSRDQSTSCRGRKPQHSSRSSDVRFLGAGVPVPEKGCGNGRPNTSFASLAPVMTTVCNADSHNSQASAPSGVREALTIIAFGTGNKSLIRTVAAASESHAAPPPAGSQHNPSTGTHQGCHAGCASSSGASEMMQAVESHAVPVSFKPQQGQGGSHSSLPFTGENVLEIVLAGLVLTGVGLMLKRRAKHERPSGAQLASR